MDESQWYYATIHQGAHDYYYKDILGLSRPQLNTTFSRQMKIGARQIASSSVHLNQLADWGVFPAIYLCAWGRSSERIYGTTIHELTHSAHHQMSPASYNKLVWKAYIEPEAWVNDTDKYKSAKRTLESWATAVEITLTNLRYNRLGSLNFEYRIEGKRLGNFQETRLTNDDTYSNFYTPAFFDLTDNVNQRVFFNNDLTRPQDAISGFTILQIQNIVKDSNSWGEVKIKLSTQYPGSATLIEELLGNWQ